MRGKLAPPSVNPAQLPRTALVSRVCDDPAAKLVLVRSPAGFGKSTLLDQCRQHWEAAGVATAWLNIDANDNDPSRLVLCLVSALQNLSPHTDEHEAAASTNDAHDATLGEVALQLFDRIAELEQPLALFLDEFEALHDAAALGLVRELIAHLPPKGRVVIASRSSPDLPLERLRARGLCIDIEAEQLRFTPDETAAYVTEKRRIPLGAEELAKLHERTEGWAAALWLVTLALERPHDHSFDRAAFIARFTGSNDGIAGYLTECVLAGQSAATRRFLLRTSILRQLNPSLCQALVPELDAALV